ALNIAMRLSPHPPGWYTHMFALANLWIGDLATAQKAAEENFQMPGEDPDCHVNLALIYALQQREDESARMISDLKKKFPALNIAMRLSPHPPGWYTHMFALANLWIGDLATAQKAAEENFQMPGEDPDCHVNLALIYALQQREDESARMISDLKKKFPAFS